MEIKVTQNILDVNTIDTFINSLSKYQLMFEQEIINNDYFIDIFKNNIFLNTYRNELTTNCLNKKTLNISLFDPKRNQIKKDKLLGPDTLIVLLKVPIFFKDKIINTIYNVISYFNNDIYNNSYGELFIGNKKVLALDSKTLNDQLAIDFFVPCTKNSLYYIGDSRYDSLVININELSDAFTKEFKKVIYDCKIN